MASPTIDPALLETPAYKAALAEIKASGLDTMEKIGAKATELGMADRWKQIQADSQTRQVEMQALEKDNEAHMLRRKEFEDHAKSAMKKTSATGWVATVAIAIVTFLNVKNKSSWSNLKKNVTTGVGGVVGGGIIGFIGSKIFGSGISARGEALEKENLELMRRSDDIAMRDGEVKAQFVQEMAQKIVERNQAPDTTFQDKLKAEQASPQTSQARG